VAEAGNGNEEPGSKIEAQGQKGSESKAEKTGRVESKLPDAKMKSYSRFEMAADGEQALFRLVIPRAWLGGIKTIHPGTMENLYLVATTGLVEDARGRTLRLLPVLDFEFGQMIRDLQRTGRELEIEGQLFTMNGRRFLHVVRAQVVA